MASKRERGLGELYRDDPERADALVFGRRAAKVEGEVDRRGFLRGAGLAAMSAAVGGAIPFAANMPAGLIPAALAQTPPAAPPAAAPAAPPGPKLLSMDGKAALVVLQDRPLNAETPTHLLDDDVTPIENFFIRNNGLVPEAPRDPAAWKIKIDGEVNTPLELTVGELATRFTNVTAQLQLECGGNGRSFFQPEARGNQWGNGAVGCAEWTGVRLMDVLKAAGLKPSAVYTAHYGADPTLTGSTETPTISRGVPIAKAMDDNTLIATRMNGQPIPLIHGGPVRLVVPGYPGSTSHKWLTRIWIRDKEHDGPGMTGAAYRVTRTPIVPGGTTPDSNLRVLESMPVRSVITNIPNGTTLPDGVRDLVVRGHAWAGERMVRTVAVSINYGTSWALTQLNPPPNRHAWQNWQTTVTLPSAGYFEIWSRATDQDGNMQPHVAGNWNPQGYGANPVQRVAVLVKA
jgi:DMSO/TMAO reductase YedYZ molybdopterin-dependent catalytic subunit